MKCIMVILGAFASPFVTAQYRPVRGILAGGQRSNNDVRKLRSVLQAEVGALACQRMYRMRRIADKCDTAPDIISRVLRA